MTLTRLWFRGNRHFLMSISLQVIVVLLLILIVLPLGDHAIILWRGILSPVALSDETDLNNQIALWERNNERLSAQVDSVGSRVQKFDSQDEQLTFIQSTANARRLSLISCDLRAADGVKGESVRAFDLQLRGSFRDLGKFVTDLESSSLPLRVEKISLESGENRSTSLNVSLTLMAKSR